MAVSTISIRHIEDYYSRRQESAANGESCFQDFCLQHPPSEGEWLALVIFLGNMINSRDASKASYSDTQEQLHQ